MSKSLKQIILAKCEDNRGLASELGEFAGYASGSNFSKVLRNEEKEIEKLDGFMKVVDFVCDKDERLNKNELLLSFAKSLNPDKMTIRQLLEYATLFYNYDLVKVITDNLKSSDKKDSIEWGLVYEIHRQVQTKEISCCEGFNLLCDFNKSRREIKVFAKLAQIYCQYDLRNINMINCITQSMEEDVKLIKNDFIRNAFMGRIFRIKVDANFHTDKIGRLVESLFRIKDALDPTKTMVYLQIGNSYMTKSYDKAMHYYTKAWEHKTIKSEFEIKQSINFTSLLWNRLDNFQSDGTQSNDLFYYIRSGNKEMALRTLDKINFETLNNHQKAFNYFYRGLLFNDKTAFYKSVEHFNKVGEKFYKQLPIMELKRLGEQDYILNALSA